MSQEENKRVTRPSAARETRAEPEQSALDPTLPVSAARYAELQRNGLCGIASERRFMRVDLPEAPNPDLAHLAAPLEASTIEH